jgi:hypothetical protein
MSKQDGGSAFPNVFTDQINGRDGEQSTDTYSCGGMTLRQWYKGMASGEIAAALMSRHLEHGYLESEAMYEAARLSAQLADALIAEDAARAKEG